MRILLVFVVFLTGCAHLSQSSVMPVVSGTYCTCGDYRDTFGEGIKTELEFEKTHFNDSEPIFVDVYVENLTSQDIQRDQFDPWSSSVGTPHFNFVRISDGKKDTLSPGMFDWPAWYQPDSGSQSYEPFILPAGQRIHLLHGNLRELVVGWRQRCQKELDERVLLQGDAFTKKYPALMKARASTKKHYERTVRFADEFIRGGRYDICVWAYSPSSVVRIQIEP